MDELRKRKFFEKSELLFPSPACGEGNAKLLSKKDLSILVAGLPAPKL